MPDILTDLSPPALVGAIEGNLFARFPLLRCLPNAQVYNGSDLLWTVTDYPAFLFNSVLRARLAPEDVDPAIEAAIARCRARKVPMLWLAGPSTRPADLGAHLLRHGFEGNENAPGMAADLWRLDEDWPVPLHTRIERGTYLEMLR